MFAITLKAKKDGRLYEITSPVKIPEGTIVQDKNKVEFEVRETIQINEPYYNSTKIQEVINEMYNLTEIIDED